jgi:hypothetical protein
MASSAATGSGWWLLPPPLPPRKRMSRAVISKETPAVRPLRVKMTGPPVAGSKVSRSLETKHPEKQAEHVQTLLNATIAPVVDLIIRVDARSGNLSLHTLGDPQITTEAMHQILDVAKAFLREQELAAVQQQAAQPNASPEAEPTELSTPKTEETHGKTE